jgi:hypothetical protein
MFSTFFIREIKMGLKQPMFYIFFLLLTLMVCLAVVSDSVQIGGAVGNVWRNAPDIVTTYTTILCIFGLLFAAAYFNNAATRDHRYNFNEIMFTTPVSKSGYYFGRFLGAWVLSSLTMCGVFLGFIVGTIIGPLGGWIEPDQLGPIPWNAFFANFLIFVLPNMFFSGAIIFGLASKFRSTMISFVGALLIIIMYIIGLNLLSDIENETMAGLLDIFGLNTYSVESKYFTPAEKNAIAPSLKGLLLQNRLLWIGAGVLISTLFYSIFSFKQSATRFNRFRKSIQANSVESASPISRPTSYGRVSNWTEFKSFFALNFYSITKSLLFKILFVFCAILVVTSLWGGFEYFGLKSYPVTYKVMDAISGQSGLFLFIIMVFFSGELVWRDRDVHIHEVIGASPYSALLSLVAKSFSLIAVIFLLYAAMVVVGISYQLFHGFTNIDIPLYFADFLIGALPGYIVWSFILIFIQVMINHKYIGYFVSILMFIAVDVLLSVLDIGTNMLSIGSSPSTMYSEMNGFGPGLKGAMWFALYWILLGLLGLIKAAAFWQRGTERGFVNRFKNAMSNLTNNYKILFGTVAIAWLAVAAFVYYNTQILNTYKTSDEQEELRADYEKQYKKYQHLPKLSIDQIKYSIDIFPNKRDVFVVSDIVMRNKTNTPIDAMHFILDNTWKQEVLIPDGKATLEDKEIGYTIYEIPALAPGDTMIMQIKTTFDSKGFENSVGDRSVVRNGSFFNSSSVLPQFGYNDGVELSDKFTRRKYDLEPKKMMPDLEVECGMACHRNYLSDGNSDWIDVETVISTSSDQIAIAPGSLLKSWEENGRKYFHYKVDHPSQNFYSFMSADYEIARRKWNGIDIEIYYDEAHDYNIDMMLDAVERSLDYYTTHFGPYYHKQCRIIEFPRYATFAQAFPGSMPYSEAFGFIIDLEDAEKNNVIDAVIAHEMAHQWWAHQVVSSFMQGGTMLVESFAEYSSLMVMKNQLNDDIKMKEFLKYDFNRYLRGRSSETRKEVPLNKVENQAYIHYGKGSVILYALQDYIGEDSVNSALKSFLEEYRYAEPPYPNTHDFMRHLRPRVPDSLKYVLTDWIEEITLYDFRLTNAKLIESESNQFKVELEVYANKLKADSIGNEISVDINDWVDIGFYSDEDEKELFYYERVKLTGQDKKIEFVLDKKPLKAAIDPRRMLIERVISDNVKRIEN